MVKKRNLGCKVKITTTVPHAAYVSIKHNHWKYNELILLGMQAKRDNPQIIERLNTLENGNKRLQAKLTEFYSKLADLGKVEDPQPKPKKKEKELDYA